MIKEGYKQIIELSIGDVVLEGELVIPETAEGIVVFAHGSGSSRFSPRNRYVAERLQEQNFGTFLVDLLTESEDKVRNNRFDIELLTERLMDITRPLFDDPHAENKNIGYFGASTGAASALKAAARFGDKIKAVVSRGGRPDLALRELPDVTAATRLIVGGLDQPVIGMNEVAFNHLTTTNKDLVIIPGASHLFEEAGKLEEVADNASEWFRKHLTSSM